MNTLQLYRIKPEPQWVKLGRADIPPGSALRCESWENGSWMLITSVVGNGVWADHRVTTFQQMFDGEWQIKRPGEDWQPCKKEVQP